MDKAQIAAMIKAKMAGQPQTQAAPAPAPVLVPAPAPVAPVALVVAPVAPASQDAPNAPTDAPDRFQGLASVYAGRRAGDVIRLPDGRVGTLRGWRHVAGAMIALLVDPDGAVMVAGRLDMARAYVMIPTGGGSAKRGPVVKPSADTGGIKVECVR